MRYEFEGSPSFPVIKVYLSKGESIKAEAGSMVAMSSGMKLTGKMDGGIGKAIGRMFSGESFFMQVIEAVDKDGWVMLATAMPGSFGELKLDGNTEWLVQKNGFLAGEETIEVSTKAQSLLRGMLSGEGFFVVKLRGTGTAFLSTYGAIHTVDIPAGEDVLIDNGHLVAWPASLQYEIVKGAKSWVSSVTSGEGVACRFEGPGQVMIQTRNPRDLGGWLFPYLPIPRRN